MEELMGARSPKPRQEDSSQPNTSNNTKRAKAGAETITSGK